MENLSRRALVASVAALEFNRKCSALDAAGTPEADAETGRLSKADQDAAGALADIKRVTRQDAIALLQYVADLEGRGDEHDFEDEADGKTKQLCYFVQSNAAEFLSKITLAAWQSLAPSRPGLAGLLQWASPGGISALGLLSQHASLRRRVLLRRTVEQTALGDATQLVN